MSNKNTEPTYEGKPARSWGCFLLAFFLAGAGAIVALVIPPAMVAANPALSIGGLFAFLLLIAFLVSQADRRARNAGALAPDDRQRDEIAGFYKLMIAGGFLVLIVLAIAGALGGATK